MPDLEAGTLERATPKKMQAAATKVTTACCSPQNAAKVPKFSGGRNKKFGEIFWAGGAAGSAAALAALAAEGNLLAVGEVAAEFGERLSFPPGDQHGHRVARGAEDFLTMLRFLSDEAILERADQVLAVEIEELERLRARLGADFLRAVRLLLGGIERGGKIIVIGVGKSGQIGDKIAATFASTGCVCVALNALNALHGDVGVVEDGDVVIALSYSGETDELLKTLSVLRRFTVELIGITGGVDSTLARLSDVTLDVAVEKEACPLNLAPTSSTTAMLALGDALAMVVLEAKALSREDFSRYHPSGSLGRALLTQVTDVMRGRERITTVAADETVQAVLRKMSEGKNGAAIIEDADRRLGGIFTHGDFARLFNESTDIANEPVGRHMTRHPVQIARSALAIEVLALLRVHQVDEIVVVEEDNRVAGIIDVQDLSRHRLL